MTQAKAGDTVTIEYTGRLDDNTIFESFRGDESVRLTIGESCKISALQEGIVGMEPGECKTLRIAAEEAYGAYDRELVKTVSRRVFTKGLDPEVGQRLKATRMDGREFTVTVREVSDNCVTLDANHLLAGKDLTFDIQLMEINPEI